MQIWKVFSNLYNFMTFWYWQGWIGKISIVFANIIKSYFISAIESWVCQRAWWNTLLSFECQLSCQQRNTTVSSFLLHSHLKQDFRKKHGSTWFQVSHCLCWVTRCRWWKEKNNPSLPPREQQCPSSIQLEYSAGKNIKPRKQVIFFHVCVTVFPSYCQASGCSYLEREKTALIYTILQENPVRIDLKSSKILIRFLRNLSQVLKT